MFVYLDNAATSRFKPQGVESALLYDLRHSANSGRSGSNDALLAEQKIEECRRSLLCALKGGGAYQIVFTKSCTEALNLALFGSIKGGERVVTTANEHNAVLRPLFELKRRGLISLDIVEQQADGAVDMQKLLESAKHADIVVLGGVCNVTGAKQEIGEIAAKAKRHDCKLIIDGAQCVPLQPLELLNMDIDMLACAGHKGLHGVQGTGFLAVKADEELTPLIYGGTGTYSNSLSQPRDFPEGFEAGTQFAGGIAALKQGAEWSFKHADSTRALFEKFTQTTLYNLKNIGCTLYSASSDAGIVSFNIADADSGYIAEMLNSYGIATRSGLHCAPLVHRHFGTMEQGMVRVSFGVESTEKDVAYLCSAVENIYRKITG